MSYVHSRRANAVSRHAITVALVAAIAIPSHAASAQLGGLVRKARDKVVENQVEKQVEKRASDPGAPPKFDEVTVELTSERVAQMIKGLTAGRAVLSGREPLVSRRDAVGTKSADLSSQNAKLINAYTDKKYQNERCRNDAMNASSEKRRAVADKEVKEWQAKAMSDPAFRDKAVAIGMKMTEAQARGDTAAFMKLAAEMGLKADDPKPDTLAADKACGRPPAKPAVLAQIDSLDGIAKELSEQIRKMEEKSAATEVTESGLTERQFFMARERIEAYLSSVKYKSKPSGFSSSEMEALGARRTDLEKVM
jgi:hypothetical protein